MKKQVTENLISMFGADAEFFARQIGLHDAMTKVVTENPEVMDYRISRSGRNFLFATRIPGSDQIQWMAATGIGASEFGAKWIELLGSVGIADLSTKSIVGHCQPTPPINSSASN